MSAWSPFGSKLTTISCTCATVVSAVGLAVLLDHGRLITIFPARGDLSRTLCAAATTSWFAFIVSAARDRIEARLDRNHIEHQQIIGRLNELYRRLDHVHTRLGDLNDCIPKAITEYGDERETHGYLAHAVGQTARFHKPYLVPNE